MRKVERARNLHSFITAYIQVAIGRRLRFQAPLPAEILQLNRQYNPDSPPIRHRSDMAPCIQPPHHRTDLLRYTPPSQPGYYREACTYSLTGSCHSRALLATRARGHRLPRRSSLSCFFTSPIRISMAAIRQGRAAALLPRASDVRPDHPRSPAGAPSDSCYYGPGSRDPTNTAAKIAESCRAQQCVRPCSSSFAAAR